MRVRPAQIFSVLLALAAMIGVSGCEGQAAFSVEPNPATPVTNVADLNIVTGQVVFVPAYSRVRFPVNGTFNDLAVTLAIHNADLEHDIIIRSVRYYDTAGELVDEFVETPTRLGALATTGFVVGNSDETGAGWGTNFVVEWIAEQPVYEPVIEALIYSNGGLEGISFISPGRILSQEP